MTHPFGSNSVGGSSAPCPLGNLKVVVKQRADTKAPKCAVGVELTGPKLMQTTLAAGQKEVEFQHLPAGEYKVRITADQPYIDSYEVPNPVPAQVENHQTKSVDVLIDSFAIVNVVVKRTDGKAIEGEVAVRLAREVKEGGPSERLVTKNLKGTFVTVRAGNYKVRVELAPELLVRYVDPVEVSLSVPQGAAPITLDLPLTPLPWVMLKVVAASGPPIAGIEATLKDPSAAVVKGTADKAFVELNAKAAGTGAFSVDELLVNPAAPDDGWEFVELDTKG